MEERLRAGESIPRIYFSLALPFVLSMVAVLVMVAFSFGGQPLIGYLYGAGEMARLRELLRFCLRFVCGLSAALSAVLIVGAPVFMVPLLHYNGIVAAQLAADVLNVGVAALLYRFSLWQELRA